MRIVFDAFLDMLYPKDLTCFCCGREISGGTGGLCEECRTGLRIARPYPLPLYLDGCVSAFEYDCPIGDAIRNLKYARKTYLADILGDLLPFDETIGAGWIIPVPLHPKRLSMRGFNQSELLAEALSGRTGVPVQKDLLVRTIHTDPQAGLSGKERRNNLKGAFSCRKALTGETVLLVDDVITTGSTLSACAEALKKSGIRKVFACTVASAVE